MRYYRKPAIVEAEQWTGSNGSWDRILKMGLPRWKFCEWESDTFIFKTFEGDCIVKRGDWIAKNDKNKFYVIKNDVFEYAYELV